KITSILRSGGRAHLEPHSFPTRRSSDLAVPQALGRGPAGPGRMDGKGVQVEGHAVGAGGGAVHAHDLGVAARGHVAVEIAHGPRSEEHTSELQSRENLVCRLLPEKKNNI